MKATKSVDGRWRVTARISFRVDLESAASAIAGQLYDDMIEPDEVPSLSANKLASALRNALHREGEGIVFTGERFADGPEDWRELAAEVTKRLIETGVFPSSPQPI